MKDEKVQRAIIVVQQHMTPFARQSLLETERSKYHMEQFHEQARQPGVLRAYSSANAELICGRRSCW